MASSKPPEPPNYVGAAQAQGQANLQAAIASGIINNPTVNNPYGTQNVTWQYERNKAGQIVRAIPTITQKFSPEQQALFDQSMEAKGNLGDAAVSGSANVADLLKSGLDFSGLPGAPKNSGQRREDVIAAMMGRVNQDIGRQRENTQSELIAAGIRPGTKAYAAQMDLINRQQNDAEQQAILAGGQEATRDFGMDNQARQQALAEMLTQRQTPLNEVNALMSGSQVNNPFAGGLGYQAGANVGAAPIAGAIAQQGQAQQGMYNQQQANMNNNISAGAGLIGSLGSAAMRY